MKIRLSQRNQDAKINRSKKSKLIRNSDLELIKKNGIIASKSLASVLTLEHMQNPIFVERKKVGNFKNKFSFQFFIGNLLC